MLRIFYFSLSLASLLAAGASATFADATQGEQSARRWCASCHVVSRDQPQGNTQAPTFSEIAKVNTVDAAHIALFLLAPHPRMPDMNLTRAEAADLAAYIASQKR